MPLRSNLVMLVPAILPLLGCVQLREHGLRSTHDGAADAALDATGPGSDMAPGAIQDGAAPMDTTPHVPAIACTPRAVGCTTDNLSTRTCDDQGHWVVNPPCPSETTCSGGLCLCAPGFCEEGAIETQATGLVGDLAAGGRFLFLAVNGPLASIRRFDLQAQPPTETVVHSGEPDFSVFALDSDSTGNLSWCSDVRAVPTRSGQVATRSGQVIYGDRPLDAVACTHVRRRDNLVYYAGDVLYRRALDASTPAETVTRETMDSFEFAGDALYFVGVLNDEAFLKRISLADPTVVDIILRRPSATFFQVMPDASDVYLITDGQILRVPRVATAPPEVFWQESEPSAWAMAQTDSHVYWTTTTASDPAGCSEAQVFRRPKLGGPATVLSRVTGYCAGQLVVVGDHLYAVVWGGLPSVAPTRILRLRQ